MTKLHRVDVDGPVHECLISPRDSEINRFQLALDIKRELEAMPGTKATFRPNKLDSLGDRAQLHDGMLLLQGSWPVPDTMNDGGSNFKRWVNPNYIHKQQFSDVVVECDCGAKIARTVPKEDEQLFTGEFDHREDCTIADRLRARANIHEKRAEILQEGMVYGHSAREMRDRLAYNHPSVGDFSERMNLSIESFKEEYRSRRGNTAAILSHKYKPDKIGEVYGVVGNTIRQSIKRRTQYHPPTLREKRGVS